MGAIWLYPNLLLCAIFLLSLSFHLIFLVLMIPPAVLLLTRSTSDRIALNASVSEAIFPLRVVTLLDLDKASSWKTLRLIYGGTYRTQNSLPWRAIMGDFLKFAPIVVVDTRQVSIPILQEVREVAVKNVAYKTIFIATDDGTVPALSELLRHDALEEADRIDIKKHLYGTNEPGLIPDLKRLTSSPANVPTRERPVKSILTEAQGV